MENDTTTVASDTQEDDANKGTTTTDQNTTTTESKTATDTTGSDNLDTSKSTDTSADDDKSTTEVTTDTSTPKFDTDLDEWAVKTNRPVPETDRERALYQEIRDGQREFSRSKQTKDALTDAEKAIQTAKPADDKQVTDDDDDERDPVEKRQDAIESQLTEERHLRLRGEYFTEKSVTPEQSKVMGEILKEKVDRAATPEAKKQAFDYWTHPDQLADWHELAKARLTTATDTTVIEEEAARKERERIAKESQAAGTSRNATTTTTEKKSGYNRTEYLKSDD